jgi:hypothetical protein
VRGILARRGQSDQRYAYKSGGQKLQHQLGATRQAQVPLAHHLYIVIGKANGAKRDGGKNGQPYICVGKVGPEQRRNNNGDGYQHSTHGGRAGFFLVALGAFFTDVLANLEIAELLDDGRANNHAHEERREAGKCRPESDVPENSERRKMRE